MNVAKIIQPCKRIPSASALLVCITIAGCGGNDALGPPAGRAVDGSVPSNNAPVVQAGQAQPVAAPAAPSVETQRLEQLERNQEMMAEIRDLRDAIERQQFQYDRLQKAYDDQMRQMELKINENGALLAEMQQLQQNELSTNTGASVSSQTVTPSTSAYTQDTDTSTSGYVQPTVVTPTATANANVNVQEQQPTGQRIIRLGSDPGSSSDAATTQGSTASAPTADRTLVAVSAQARDQYDAAFEMLKQSRYDEAINGFESFIQGNGDTDLADDARYWVGEAHYVSRDLPQAVRSFQQLVVDYPRSSRAPDALLKIGYIQYEMGSYSESRSTLSTVLDRFPGTPVANAASVRLDKMTREGN